MEEISPKGRVTKNNFIKYLSPFLRDIECSKLEQGRYSMKWSPTTEVQGGVVQTSENASSTQTNNQQTITSQTPVQQLGSSQTPNTQETENQTASSQQTSSSQVSEQQTNSVSDSINSQISQQQLYEAGRNQSDIGKV